MAPAVWALNIKPRQLSWRSRLSVGYKGARGMRVATPLFHVLWLGGLWGFLFYVLTENRGTYRSPVQPPVAAPPPPPGTLSLVSSHEMAYATRMGVQVSGLEGSSGEQILPQKR
jgi:hypothetical protein